MKYPKSVFKHSFKSSCNETTYRLRNVHYCYILCYSEVEGKTFLLNDTVEKISMIAKGKMKYID